MSDRTPAPLWINLYMPTKSGKQRQVAGIPINENHDLFSYIKEGTLTPELLMKLMTAQFNWVNSDEDSNELAI